MEDFMRAVSLVLGLGLHPILFLSCDVATGFAGSPGTGGRIVQMHAAAEPAIASSSAAVHVHRLFACFFTYFILLSRRA